MKPWFSLKKGTQGVHVEYGNGATTLLVENVEIRPNDPFDVSLDLGKNLRTRNKQENTYVDAEHLSGEMDTLKSVQISDGTVIKGVTDQLKRMEKSNSLPGHIRLRVLLKGEHWYAVKLHWQSEYSLMLNVLSETEGD